MKILWLSWKDGSHPQAGGAEVVNEQLARRLVRDGHAVTFLVAGYPGCSEREDRDGFTIVRVGGRFSVYWRAYRYYKAHLAEWPDLVIDEVNTIPFFAKFYIKQKNILFIHQLAREIWFYQMPFPLSLVGYLLEPLYLRLLSSNFYLSPAVITVSESTKRDLMRYGFKSEKIHIISEGIELEPLSSLDFPLVTKYPVPTILALGAVRLMKRTHHIIKAFEILKRFLPSAKLIIAGSTGGSYGARVLERVRRSPYVRDINCLGQVDAQKKIELLQKSHILAMTSVKEGWGLVVTEANSQGTPAVVYDVDGLRDGVRQGSTGLICRKNSPQELARLMDEILKDPEQYARLRENAWQWSKEITFDRSYEQFIKLVRDV